MWHQNRTVFRNSSGSSKKRLIANGIGNHWRKGIEHHPSFEESQATQGSPHSPESRSTRGACSQGSGFVPPSKAMRQVWKSGLCPQPASFSVLTALWTPQNQSWTENWLWMLRRESAMMTEEWHCLRRRELTKAAERDRIGAISRFYTGRKLQRLLHPTAPAPHSPLLYTDIPDTVLVAGNSNYLAAFRAELAPCLVQTELHGSVCIHGIAPADLGKFLCLAEQRGLKAQLAGQKRLVQSATD